MLISRVNGQRALVEHELWGLPIVTLPPSKDKAVLPSSLRLFQTNSSNRERGDREKFLLPNLMLDYSVSLKLTLFPLFRFLDSMSTKGDDNNQNLLGNFQSFVEFSSNLARVLTLYRTISEETWRVWTRKIWHSSHDLLLLLLCSVSSRRYILSRGLESRFKLEPVEERR